jgi:hypothetical protein
MHFCKSTFVQHTGMHLSILPYVHMYMHVCMQACVHTSAPHIFTCTYTYAGMHLRVGDEAVLIQSIATDTLTVVRAALSTTAATYTAGTRVTLWHNIMENSITYITVSSGGTNYIDGDLGLTDVVGGAGFLSTYTVTAGAIVQAQIIIVSHGHGYTTDPTAVMYYTGTLDVMDLSIVSIVVTDGGAGYTQGQVQTFLLVACLCDFYFSVV